MAYQNADGLGDGIHDHAEEVENSRPPSNMTNRSGSSLGPLRTGRGTPTCLNPAVGSSQDVPVDIPRRSPLPPIGSDGAAESAVSSESEVDISIDDNTTDNQERRHHPKVLKGYRSEIFEPDEMITREIAKKVVKVSDGKTKSVVEMECQTEWSWLEDMKRLEALEEKSARYSAPNSGHEADDDDNSEDDEDESEEPSAKPETPKVKVKVPEIPKVQTAPKAFTVNNSLPGGSHVAPSVPVSTGPSLREDDYGIPILQMSTDSDTSDEETPSEMENPDEMKEAQDFIGTLPSIGPPQILQYNRESEKKEIDPIDPENLNPEFVGKLGGIFQGICEFCGNTIRRFPTMEEQKTQPPEKIYCCDEYRQFVQFMVSHPLQEKFNVDTRIDVSPHAPFGSKKARNAAKERAAQRMRERELARQQASIGALGGGGGGPHNFYQSNQVGHPTAADDSIASASSVAIERTHPTGSYATLVGLARQMKTINYTLSSQRCLEEGWTIRPPSPLAEGEQEAEVFEPLPVLPPWADPEKHYQQYHKGCAHKSKPHFHNIFFELEDSIPTPKHNGLVRKFYPDGDKFIILFPDGTGNVFYPSGRPAISIVALEEKGLYSYIVTDDSEAKARVSAVFENTGCGTTYYPKGDIRVCLDQLGGVELDAHGAKKRKWSWQDQAQHVHAPPIQPMTLAVNPQCAVRIMSQNNISLTFTANKRSVRFQVGAHLKLVSPENIPEADIDDDQLFRDEVRNRIHELLSKVNNLLKFPKSPKLDKLPNPPHLIIKQQRTEKLRTMRREKTMAKEKKPPTPVVVVN